jgi:hypothetical protein
MVFMKRFALDAIFSFDDVYRKNGLTLVEIDMPLGGRCKNGHSTFETLPIYHKGRLVKQFEYKLPVK